MEILKNKNFRRLIIGQATSQFGSNMQQFALSLYVLAITGSATIFASIIAISIVPRLVLSPIAGVFGDWFDRKKSIVRLDLLNGVLIGAYAVYYFLNGSLSLPSIYLLVVLLEITEIFFGCSMAAVVPSMLPKEKLLEANRIKAIVASFSNIASPVLASMMYSFFGIQILLIVNAISFVVSALSEMTIDIPKLNKKPVKLDMKSFVTDLKEGINIVKNTKMIRLIISIGVIINFSLSALFGVGVLYIVLEIMRASEVEYGLITTAMASSMLVGPLLLGKFISKMKVGKLFITSFGLINVFIFLMGILSTEAFLSMFDSNVIPLSILGVLVFLSGMLSTLVNVSIGTLFDTLVPIEFMGRTASITNLCLLIATPIGQILFGFGIDFLSTSLTFFIINGIILVTLVYFRKPFIESDRESHKPVVQTHTAEEVRVMEPVMENA